MEPRSNPYSDEKAIYISYLDQFTGQPPYMVNTKGTQMGPVVGFGMRRGLSTVRDLGAKKQAWKQIHYLPSSSRAWVLWWVDILTTPFPRRRAASKFQARTWGSEGRPLQRRARAPVRPLLAERKVGLQLW
jgi:hypothetical protein